MRAMRRLIMMVLAVLFPAACAIDPAVPARSSAAIVERPSSTATPESPPATSEPTPIPTIAATAMATVTALPTADVLLRVGRLIDGTGAPPIDDAAVAIRGAEIVAVGRADALHVAAARTIDLPDATLMPGLINAHVHSADLSPDEMRAWTRAGVTTVRDLSGPRDAILARAGEFERGADASLPRLLAAGPMLTVAGGHPLPIYGASERVLAVDGPDDARAAVNALIDQGAHQIKIAVSGRTDVAWPELSDDEIRAITEAAHARGARVAAHIDRAAALQRAVANGIDDAAHLPRDRVPDDTIALMIERGVALIPTIDVYANLAEARGVGAAWERSTLPIMADNLRRFVAAGGTIALGDDYGNPGVALGLPIDEIDRWLAAGLTPMQVIVAATRGGAIVCGLDEQIGTIAPGKRADLLAVDGDPLAEIAALERVALVLRDGEIVVQR